MKTFDGYKKRSLDGENILLANGGDKSLSDFVGSLNWDSTNRKLQYKSPNASSYTDIVTFGSNAFTETSQDYLPLSGGTLTGGLGIGNDTNYWHIFLGGSAGEHVTLHNAAWIEGRCAAMDWYNGDTHVGGICVKDAAYFVEANGTLRTLYHSGNIPTWNQNTTGSSGTTYKLWTTSHPNDWYLRSYWDGTYFWLTARNGSESELPNAVAYSNNSGTANYSNTAGSTSILTRTWQRGGNCLTIYENQTRSYMVDSDTSNKPNNSAGFIISNGWDWGTGGTLLFQDMDGGDSGRIWTNAKHCDGNWQGWLKVAFSGEALPANGGTSTYTNILNSLGTISAISGTSRYTSGLRFGRVYVSGYPWDYGTTITMEDGGFGAELIFNGIGGGGATGSGQMAFRTHSDWGNSEWGGWRTVLDTSNYSSYALPLSGGTVTGLTLFSFLGDHAIQTPSIRGYEGNGLSGLYIHMYERVHIGSPNGWGSRNAPSYGLSTYGGAWLATDTGNVGIGTTSPAHKLHIYADANQPMKIQSATGGCWLDFLSSTSNIWSIGAIDSTSFGVYNRNDNTYKTYITNNGNVGIGVYPSYKLEVDGDTWVRGALRVGSSNTDNYIAFYGNYGDAPGSFVTSFIGEHLWGGSESTELLLMKFNDVGDGYSGTTVSGAGPDRIRYLAHSHVFLVMTDTNQGDFTTMANYTGNSTKFDISLYRITSYNPLMIQIPNIWLGTSYLLLGRPDSTNYNDRAVIGVTDGNLHIDSYSGHDLYLNYYNGNTVRFGSAGYYITNNGSYYNGTAEYSNNSDKVDGYHSSLLLKKYSIWGNLSSSGWYRVANVTSYGGNVVVNFGGHYNHQPPTPASFYISHSYDATTITQIGKCSYIGWVTKIRVVHHDTYLYYIDFYYAGSYNGINVDVVPDGYFEGSIDMIGFTALGGSYDDHGHAMCWTRSTLIAQELYASDYPYRECDSHPYHAYFTYNDYGDGRWYFRVAPATPAAIRVDYATNASYSDTSTSTYQLLGWAGNECQIGAGLTANNLWINYRDTYGGGHNENPLYYYYLGDKNGSWGTTTLYHGHSYSNGRAYIHSDWLLIEDTSGIYWPNACNSTHFHPNQGNFTYGNLAIRGSVNGYSGINLGNSSSYLTIMDNGTDKGLYQEGQRWPFYYNSSNQRIGIRDSGGDYDINLFGNTYTSGWIYSHYVHSRTHLYVQGTSYFGRDSYGDAYYHTGYTLRCYDNICNYNYTYNRAVIGDSTISDYTLDVNGSMRVRESIAISTNNTTGGGIVFADDGDIVDLNDGYITLRASHGLQIYSANKGGSLVLKLHSNGTLYNYGVYHYNYGSSDYLFTTDGGVKSKYYALNYEGWWGSGSGQNVDGASGMIFAYSDHGVPGIWGTMITILCDRNSYYNTLIYGDGWNNQLYYRTRSSDNGQHEWKTLIDSGNIGSQSVNYASSAGSSSTSSYSYRLHRRDDGSNYNVLTYWTGSYWHLDGYYEDSYHAGCLVAFADSAGYISSQTPQLAASFENNEITVLGYTNSEDGSSWYRPLLNGGTGGIHKAIDFRWYDNHWAIGNIRSGSTGSDGFGFYYKANSSSYLSIKFQIDTSGNSYGRGSFYSNSDIRYKQIENYLDIPLNNIANLSIFNYTWTDDKHDDAIHSGMSAQEVELILPYLVSGDEFKSLNYANFGAIASVLCAREILNTNSRIEQLEEKVKQLTLKLLKYENI